MVTKSSGCSLFVYVPTPEKYADSEWSPFRPCRHVQKRKYSCTHSKFEKEPRVLNKKHDVWVAVPVWMGGRQKVSLSWRELNYRYCVAPLVACRFTDCAIAVYVT
jgi:hypothetical protein